MMKPLKARIALFRARNYGAGKNAKRACTCALLIFAPPYRGTLSGQDLRVVDVYGLSISICITNILYVRARIHVHVRDTRVPVMSTVYPSSSVKGKRHERRASLEKFRNACTFNGTRKGLGEVRTECGDVPH